jgi:catechol 2,3-dioxygenase-like lactoylglutathione lyase family enzyme
MTAAFDLDHVGIAVRDLGAAAAAYRRLGFVLSGRSYHMAPAGPGVAPSPRGTGNHCVMLPQGYVELIGITDPAYQGRLRHHLARYQGLHIVAFGCADAAAAVAALHKRGEKIEPPRRLTRPIAELGKQATAEFSIVDLPAPANEGYYIAIEHHTREALWQPHLLPHPNGARALIALTVCAADPADYARRLAATLGAPAETEHGVHTVELAFGSVDAVDAAGLDRRYPGVMAPTLPFVAGIAVTVDDIARARARLQANGVAYQSRSSGSIWVAPADACGAVIEFVSA